MHFYMPSKCIHSPVLNNGPSEYMEYTIPIMCSRSNQFPMGWPHPKKGNKNAANPPPPAPVKSPGISTRLLNVYGNMY